MTAQCGNDDEHIKLRKSKNKKDDLERQDETCDDSIISSEQDPKKSNLSKRTFKNGKLEIGKEDGHQSRPGTPKEEGEGR